MKETESGGSGALDRCFLEIAPAGGGFQTVARVLDDSVCVPSTLLVSPPFVPGASFNHRFRFDTVANTFPGWTATTLRTRR